MASTPSRQLLKDISMEDVTALSQSNNPLYPACSRSLSLAVALQRDDKRLVMCPHCGWEMDE